MTKCYISKYIVLIVPQSTMLLHVYGRQHASWRHLAFWGTLAYAFTSCKNSENAKMTIKIASYLWKFCVLPFLNQQRTNVGANLKLIFKCFSKISKSFFRKEKKSVNCDFSIDISIYNCSLNREIIWLDDIIE